MLHHRTDDIELRAMHIAQQEAEPIWRETGNFQTWYIAYMASYRQVYRELLTLQPGYVH